MRSALALAMCAVAACKSMAPAYERPAAAVPAQLGGGSGSGAERASAVPWQAFVHDAKLQQVIAQALAQSRDLRRSALNIESARSLYRIQRAAQLPSIDAVAAITSTRSLLGTAGNNTFTSTVYAAQAGLATWEIDLFGRLRSLSDAKLHAYFSTVETAKATRISLIGEVASAWVTLGADRSRLAIATETMASSKKTMELTEALVTGGTSNRGDFWQAATVFHQARADVALLTSTIEQDRDALDLLAGSRVADALLPEQLPDRLDWFADVPVGLSSDVLLERPDVVAAEQDLMAANANIGAARAQFFPSLSLTANGGLASTGLAALFTGPAFVFSLAPNLALPLFRGGANRANLAYTETQKQVFVAGYELAVQNAFRDVADALATRATIADQLEAQRALVDAAQKGYDLAKARYQGGVEPFLTTLVSERALYTAKNSLVTTQLAALGNRVTLYRALGGGLR